MENLRTLYLYDEAGLMHAGQYPGSQAGEADLYAYDKDQQDWYPAGYWLWNLRGEISANMSSGNFALNLPIFDLYLNDLPAIESWTKAQMGGKPGACVPETMRFNGNGYYNGGGITSDASCATASSPDFNAETITSGAEIGLWIWQQYRETGQPELPAEVLPHHGAGRHLPARLAVHRIRRLPTRRRQRPRDPVGSTGPDHRYRRRPGTVPRRDQRGDAAGDRLRAGLSAAHRTGPDRALPAHRRQHPLPAAQPPAHLRGRRRERRRPGQRRHRRLLPAIRRQPQPGERRPGAGLALRGDRRRHDRRRRQPDRAGRPDLQQPPVPQPARLDV